MLGSFFLRSTIDDIRGARGAACSASATSAAQRTAQHHGVDAAYTPWCCAVRRAADVADALHAAPRAPRMSRMCCAKKMMRAWCAREIMQVPSWPKMHSLNLPYSFNRICFARRALYCIPSWPKMHSLNLPYSFNRIHFARRALQQPARARGGRATCHVPASCHVARYDTLKAHIRGGKIFDPRNAFQYNSIFSAAVLRRFVFLFKFEKAKVVQFGNFECAW